MAAIPPLLVWFALYLYLAKINRTVQKIEEIQSKK